MNLDEAIEHCKSVAHDCRKEGTGINSMQECADDHMQLAQWLEELKAYRKKEESKLTDKEIKMIARKLKE